MQTALGNEASPILVRHLASSLIEYFVKLAHCLLNIASGDSPQRLIKPLASFVQAIGCKIFHPFSKTGRQRQAIGM